MKDSFRGTDNEVRAARRGDKEKDVVERAATGERGPHCAEHK